MFLENGTNFTVGANYKSITRVRKSQPQAYNKLALDSD